MGAYSHAGIPFEQLLWALHLETCLKCHPLYQILFVSENVPTKNLELSGLKMNDFSFDSGVTIYDMVFSIQEVKQGLIFSIEYNTFLFDAAIIAQLGRQISSLVEAIVANSKQRLSDLFSPLPTSDADRRGHDAQ
ncbi:MAG TPA: condensation domain-containing protein [Ktedonobacteraceae bacterium]